jgi:hypothetical protein
MQDSSPKHSLSSCSIEKLPDILICVCVSVGKAVALEDENEVVDKVKIATDILFMTRTVYEVSQMEYECLVAASIYWDRLVQIIPNAAKKGNWRYWWFTCMLLSSKVWDDTSMLNSEFATIFTDFGVKEVNRMEVKLLEIFQYSVSISSQEYVSHHDKLLFPAKVQRPLSVPKCNVISPEEASLVALQDHETSPSSSSFLVRAGRTLSGLTKIIRATLKPIKKRRNSNTRKVYAVSAPPSPTSRTTELHDTTDMSDSTNSE